MPCGFRFAPYHQFRDDFQISTQRSRFSVRFLKFRGSMIQHGRFPIYSWVPILLIWCRFAPLSKTRGVIISARGVVFCALRRVRCASKNYNDKRSTPAPLLRSGTASFHGVDTISVSRRNPRFRNMSVLLLKRAAFLMTVKIALHWTRSH